MFLLSPAPLQHAQKYSTLLRTGWKQEQHYHSPLLMNVSHVLQLYWNIDRNTIFTLSPLPLGSSHPPAVTVVHLTVMACCHRVGQQRTAPNWGLSHATETSTNKKSFKGRGPGQVICTFPKLNVYFSSWQHLEVCRLFICILETAI